MAFEPTKDPRDFLRFFPTPGKGLRTQPGAPPAGDGAADGPAPTVLVASELRVGRLRRPLLGGALAAGGLLLLGFVALQIRDRYGWVFVRGPEYAAAFPNVSGLGEGAEVRYAGLAVGKVRRVAVDSADPRQVLVTFRVDEGTPVRTSTHAAVVGAGASPATYVNLRPGPLNAPAARPGTRLGVEEGPTVEDVLLRVTALLDRSDTLLAATAPLTRGDFFGQLARTTARVDTLVTAASQSSGRWGPRVERALRQTEALLARTDRVVAALDSARPALARAPGEAVATLAASRALLTDVRSGVEQGGGLRELMRNLTSAGENLSRLSARLERDPLSALQGRRNPPKPAGPALR